MKCAAPSPALSMRLPFRLPPLVWWFVPLLAVAAVAWVHLARARQVLRLAEVGQPAVVVDRNSPTGYAGGWRKLIVPEPNHVSHQWVSLLQELQSEDAWRVRWTDQDNAPTGRAVHAPSPYAWWLAFVAAVDQAVSGKSPGLAAEHTLVTAGPWLHLLFVLGAAAVVTWQFGYGAGMVVLLGLSFLQPLVGIFVPGRLSELALALVAVFLSVFGLLAAVAGRVRVDRRARAFAIAGGFGALGLWLSPAVQAPLLGGVGLGAVVIAALQRRTGAAADQPALPWRVWGLAGAAGVLLAYALEYLPRAGGDWELRAVHPVYGLTWLGWAEVLRHVDAWGRRAPLAAGWRGRLSFMLGVIGVAVLPAMLWRFETAGFAAPIPMAERLMEFGEGVAGASLLDALTRGGSAAPVLLTLLPLLGLVAVGWVVWRGTDSRQRTAAALALGPLLVALAHAFVQLRWWAVFDVVLLASLPVAFVATAGVRERTRRLGWGLAAAFVLLPAVLWAWPRGSGVEAVNTREVRALIERDLAYWLANRTGPGGAIVLAPPQVTSALLYHGGHRGLGSLSWENQDGFAAAVRLSSTTSPDEAQALFSGRGVSHVILPSWDNFLEQYASLGSQETEKTLVSLLQRWLPPRWLRPIPYELPMIEGFAGASVSVFEVVEVQEQNLALSRLAEYFVETSRPDAAVAVSGALQQAFGGELDSLVAQAQVHAARLDGPSFGRVLQSLLPLVQAGSVDPALPLDRRLALASVLSQGRQAGLARTQLQQVMSELDESRLRSLTTGELYRLLTLSENLGVAFPGEHLATLAPRLLPPELRERRARG